MVYYIHNIACHLLNVNLVVYRMPVMTMHTVMLKSVSSLLVVTGT